MLGNDVVDLKLAKHQIRWNTKAFQQKILHPIEIEKHKNTPLNFIDFWKIWTLKESAYKAHQRKYNLSPKINPFHFIVEFLSANRSKVIFEEDKYEMITHIDKNLIYSYSKGSNFHSVQNFNIEAKNSRFQKHLKRSQLDLKIRKNENEIPFMVSDNKSKPISITHHGKYFAYLYV